jgi:hypothetical protein
VDLSGPPVSKDTHSGVVQRAAVAATEAMSPRVIRVAVWLRRAGARRL